MGWSGHLVYSISDQIMSIGSMHAIYGNIYHQYTPNVSIYIPYMDPMGYPVKKMSFFLGEEMAGFSPWVAFDLWNGRNGFWIEPNIIDGCVPGKHWMACLLMTNDFNRSPQTGILYTVCVYIYICVYMHYHIIYIYIYTYTQEPTHSYMFLHDIQDLPWLATTWTHWKCSSWCLFLEVELCSSHEINTNKSSTPNHWVPP